MIENTSINETQKNIIEATLSLYLDEIRSLPPIDALDALLAINRKEISLNEIEEFKQKNIWECIEFIRTIIFHPCPQNRTESYPYFDQSSLSPNTIVYKDHEGKPAFESKGLLSLTARNDNTASPITKEATLDYINKLVKQNIDEVKNSLNGELPTFTPIGGNWFFGIESALCRLKNPKIRSLVKQGKLDSSNAIEIEAKMCPTDPRLEFLLSDIGLQMMKENYISGYCIGVYFHNLKDLEALISLNGLTAFEEGLCSSVEKLLKLPAQAISYLFTQGFQDFRIGNIRISESGMTLRDRQGQIIDIEGLLHNNRNNNSFNTSF